MYPLADRGGMAYAATQCVDDAIEATKAFLTPVDRGRWLRMAAIVFFLSIGAGAGAVPNLGGQFSVGSGVTDWEPSQEVVITDLSQVPDSVWLALAALALAAVVLVLVFGILGAIMEFVLVEAIRTETARVREPFRRHLRDGLSLFAFQALLFVLLLGLPVGGYVLLLLWPAVAAGASIGAIVGLVALLLVLVLVVGLLAALVNGFTVEFVVPVMIQREVGLVAGWRRFWPVLRGNLAEFAVYVALRWALAIAVSFVAGTATGILATVVGIPFFLLVGGLFLGTGGALTPSTIAVYVVLIVVFVLVVVALGTAVQVPLQTFTRYYQLFVLGDVAPEFDLVPDRRESVRTPEFETNDGDETTD
jgi:MFS family permease